MSLLHRLDEWATQGLGLMQEICDGLNEICVLLEYILTAIEAQNKRGQKKEKANGLAE